MRFDNLEVGKLYVISSGDTNVRNYLLAYKNLHNTATKLFVGSVVMWLGKTNLTPELKNEKMDWYAFLDQTGTVFYISNIMCRWLPEIELTVRRHRQDIDDKQETP